MPIFSHQTRRFHWSVFTVLALIGAVCFSAAGQTPTTRGKPGRRTVEPQQSLEPGQVDLSRSRVYVHVGKTGLGHVHAIEGRIASGSIRLGSRTNAGTLEFDMKSFTADTDRARKFVGLEGTTPVSTQQQVNKNMLGPDVLNVSRHPTATFKIESALEKKTDAGKTVYVLKGEFTLHGKTQAIAVQAVSSDKEGYVNLRGEFSILQSDFGITPYSTALGTIGVADQLKIWGDLWVANDP